MIVECNKIIIFSWHAARHTRLSSQVCLFMCLSTKNIP